MSLSSVLSAVYSFNRRRRRRQSSFPVPAALRALARARDRARPRRAVRATRERVRRPDDLRDESSERKLRRVVPEGVIQERV